MTKQLLNNWKRTTLLSLSFLLFFSFVSPINASVINSMESFSELENPKLDFPTIIKIEEPDDYELFALPGIGVRLIKPIRSQGKISNTNLKKYITNIENGMNNLSLISWLASVLNPLTGVVSGGTTTLATYLNNKYGGTSRLDKLRKAYNNGEHLYWAITSSTMNGHGVGVERVERLTNLNMHFYYDPIN